MPGATKLVTRKLSSDSRRRARLEVRLARPGPPASASVSSVTGGLGSQKPTMSVWLMRSASHARHMGDGLVQPKRPVEPNSMPFHGLPRPIMSLNMPNARPDISISHEVGLRVSYA